MEYKSNNYTTSYYNDSEKSGKKPSSTGNLGDSLDVSSVVNTTNTEVSSQVFSRFAVMKSLVWTISFYWHGNSMNVETIYPSKS